MILKSVPIEISRTAEGFIVKPKRSYGVGNGQTELKFKRLDRLVEFVAGHFRKRAGRGKRCAR